MNPKKIARRAYLLVLLTTLCVATALAQTTSFTYQGRLTDGGTPANGNYDLQFALFDAVSGGAQVGATQTSPNVAVSAGVFTVTLDFGASAFPGANRFLEISARLTGAGSFTTLSPRQQITSTPYAIRSLNASSADAVTVSGVPGGSGNYVQNTTTPQAGANFNISGNGTAGGTLSADIINATTQYNIGGNRLMSVAGTNNLFAGKGAGAVNTSGDQNAFFGANAGLNNTTSCCNSFFGNSAGRFTTGTNNAFFGDQAGNSNGSGSFNAFLGAKAGQLNTTGTGNVFIGAFAGDDSLTQVNYSTAIGYNVKVFSVTNATAIGANAQVDQSDSLVLGSVAGTNSATSSVNVGIGTTAPQARLHVKGTTVLDAGGSNTVQFGTPNGETGMIIVGTNRADIRFDGSTLKMVAGLGAGAQPSTNGVAVTTAGRVGVGTTSPAAQLEVKGNTPGLAGFRVLNSSGFTGFHVRDDLTVSIGQLSSSASSTHVCLDGTSTLSFCTSSLRYKEQVTPYRGGLDLIRRLHPISFTWKGNGLRDFGLGAEDVAKVEPLLVTHNNEGEIQGVKYDQLNVVLINAIKQQQEQISRQQNAIDLLTTTNAGLSARLRVVERRLRPKARSARSVVTSGARRR